MWYINFQLCPWYLLCRCHLGLGSLAVPRLLLVVEQCVTRQRPSQFLWVSSPWELVSGWQPSHRDPGCQGWACYSLLWWWACWLQLPWQQLPPQVRDWSTAIGRTWPTEWIIPPELEYVLDPATEWRRADWMMTDGRNKGQSHRVIK